MTHCGRSIVAVQVFDLRQRAKGFQVNTSKFRDWLEIFGIFGVIASLIFVGLQMRQAQEISMAQAYQERAIATSEWATGFAANPVAMSAFTKTNDVSLIADGLTDEERATTLFSFIGLYNLYDNTHYQFESGFLSNELWAMIRANLKINMRQPGIGDFFLAQQARPSFRAVVLEVSREIEDE